MPFCGPENARPAVKNSAAVVFFLLARITMKSVIATNSAKMPMLATGLPTCAVGGQDVARSCRTSFEFVCGSPRRADRVHGWRTGRRCAVMTKVVTNWPRPMSRPTLMLPNTLMAMKS